MKKITIGAIIFFCLNFKSYSQRRLAWRVVAGEDTAVVVAPPPRTNLIVNETFEGTMPPPSSELLGYTYPSGGGCCSYSHTQDDSVANYGVYSLRTELHKGDPDIGANKRAELSRPTTAEPTGAFRRMYGFRILLPTGFTTDAAPEILFQWHEVSSTSSPHFALWSQSDHFWIAYDGVATVDLGAYSLNVWNDFVFEMNWNFTAAGNMNAWLNTVQVVTNKAGINMPNDAHGPYTKNGIYKWYWKYYPASSSTTVRVVWFDDLRIGNGSSIKTDVEPGNW